MAAFQPLTGSLSPLRHLQLVQARRLHAAFLKEARKKRTRASFQTRPKRCLCTAPLARPQVAKWAAGVSLIQCVQRGRAVLLLVVGQRGGEEEDAVTQLEKKTD